MATVVGEETDYESDPEESKLSLAMRRRAASDDEEGEEREKREELRRERSDLRSGDDSDGQGGAADYEDEEDEEEEEEEEDEEVEVEEEYEERDGGVEVVGEAEVAVAVAAEVAAGVEEAVVGEEQDVEGLIEGEDEKKESEPFAVPTAGAFYMHDDRFRENAGGRHRRTLGGRKLWESKDDRKWGHDKFEEMTLQERHYDEGRRNSKGHSRGRGRNRGMDRDHGFARGNRPKPYNDSNSQNNAPMPKIVRGRGPRRYEPRIRNKTDVTQTQNKQSGKSFEKPSNTNSGRSYIPTSTVESSPVPPPRNNVFASSLNSASPPFYPSGSSSKDTSVTQKRDVSGGPNRNFRPSSVDDNFPMPQSNTSLRGKNIADSTGIDKAYHDDSLSPVKPLSGPSSFRPQGRGYALPGGQMAYQPVLPQSHGAQRNSPGQTRAQPSQQWGQRSSSGSQASSPPKTAVSVNSLEAGGELESPPESSKSKNTLGGKGKGGVQGSGRGSLLYNGAQVIGAAGNMGVGHGDQNFPFLPVMQFGGQHPGGIGVPAVGMAFPGYVGQPQLGGLGNSEMTWLPVLTGAAGALGATYCSPYLAVDGAYHPRPSGQTSSLGASSKESGNSNTNNKPRNDWKASQRPELVSDEFGQRQNKPRRYSEMNFGQ